MEALAEARSFDYVVRVRWNRDMAKGVAIFLFVCAVMALIPAPLWARIFVIGVSGSGAALLLVPAIARPAVLRVDGSGVWTRRSWLRPWRTESYSWSAIEALVIWASPLSRKVRTVGVQCRDGAEPLVRPPRPFLRFMLAREAPGIPPQIAVTAVTVSLLLLDVRRLLAAVDHFAPGVHVVDVSAGLLLHKGRPA